MAQPSPREAIGSLVSPELLKLLRSLYPLRRPALDQPESYLWFASGQQSLLELLEEAHASANESIRTPESD